MQDFFYLTIDSLKLLDVLKLSLKEELVLKDSLNELDVLKLSLKEELVLRKFPGKETGDRFFANRQDTCG